MKLVFSYTTLTDVAGLALPRSKDQHAFGIVAPLWFAIPVLSCFLGITLLLFSVALFNRPKWLVPPHLRHQDGLLSRWFRRGEERS